MVLLSHEISRRQVVPSLFNGEQWAFMNPSTIMLSWWNRNGCVSETWNYPMRYAAIVWFRASVPLCIESGVQFPEQKKKTSKGQILRWCLKAPVLGVNGSLMASSNWSIFRVTGPLCGEFTGDRWIPRTKASDAELSCFLWSPPE